MLYLRRIWRNKLAHTAATCTAGIQYSLKQILLHVGFRCIFQLSLFSNIPPTLATATLPYVPSYIFCLFKQFAYQYPKIKIIKKPTSYILLKHWVFTFHVPLKSQVRQDYKKFMRTVAQLLARDSGLTLDPNVLSNKIETFVSDAYDVEFQLANVSCFIFTNELVKRCSTENNIWKRRALPLINVWKRSIIQLANRWKRRAIPQIKKVWKLHAVLLVMKMTTNSCRLRVRLD